MLGSHRLGRAKGILRTGSRKSTGARVLFHKVIPVMSSGISRQKKCCRRSPYLALLTRRTLVVEGPTHGWHAGKPDPPVCPPVGCTRRQQTLAGPRAPPA